MKRAAGSTVGVLVGGTRARRDSGGSSWVPVVDVCGKIVSVVNGMGCMLKGEHPERVIRKTIRVNNGSCHIVLILDPNLRSSKHFPDGL